MSWANLFNKDGESEKPMNKPYSGLFGNDNKNKSTPVQPKSSLFGDDPQKAFDEQNIHQIEMWRLQRHQKSPGTEVAGAKRIYGVLGSRHIKNVTEMDRIGDFTIRSAAESNRCVDDVVTEFAELKRLLAEPKTMVLEVIELIEGSRRPLSWTERLRGVKHPDVTEVRNQVKIKTTEVASKTHAVLHAQLQPFIDNTMMALETLDNVQRDLFNAVDAMLYLSEMGVDPAIQDLARQKHAMFVKSLTLMTMNISQMKDMLKICDQNKHFITELEMNVIPVIETVLRSSIINDSGDGLQDIATKLKGIL